jgi:transcriptional regulator with XRE-family HTH domain
VPPTHAASIALCKALREILKEVRLGAGLSLNELGKRSEVDRVSISFIEQGKRIPSIETLAKIAMGLELPASRLWQMAERRIKENSNS